MSLVQEITAEVTYLKSVAIISVSTPLLPLFYFHVFPTTFLPKKTVDFSGIRSQVVRVEGEHADHHSGPKYRKNCCCNFAQKRFLNPVNFVLILDDRYAI